MTSRRKRDLELRADTVGAAHEQRVLDVRRDGGQGREATDSLDDRVRVSAPRDRLDPLDQLVACVDVDASRSVGDGHSLLGSARAKRAGFCRRAGAGGA